MAFWRPLFRRSKMEEQLERELRFHIEEHAADLVARGLDPDEARRQARLAFGSLEDAKEQCRDVRGTRWLEDSARDVRYAARRLRRSPGFTVVGVLTLALGIGASTAILSAVKPILFDPLPYPNAERLTTIADKRDDGSPLDVTFGTFREVADRTHAFDALAVMKPWQPAVTGPAERVDGQRVSASYFQVLGVRPALGRDFEPSDDRVDGPRVAILGDGLWRRRFGADPSIVGREITLDDDSYTVIGVMPSGFENVLAPSAAVWSPLRYDMSLGSAWGHHLRMAGRLRPDVAIEQATNELDSVARAPLEDFPRPPWAALPKGFLVKSLQDDVTAGARPALLAVFGAVALLLAIACVNVANLLLARGAQRRGEIAMRAALGAGRSRLVRQLLTESMLLAVLGGALGMAVAMAGVRALVALAPPGLPRPGAFVVDGAVFALGMGLTTLIGLAVGLVPALHVSRADLQSALHQSSRRVAVGHRKTRSVLVVVEVALALVLLVSSGLLLRSLERLFAVDPGFDSSHVLTMEVQSSGHRYDAADAANRYFADALDAVRRVPGVTSAALTSQLPLSGDSDVYGVHFELNPSERPDAGEGVFRYAVSPGYFETMSIPLLRGRVLDAHDAAGKPLAVVINESFARSKFREADPIGQRLRVGPSDGPWYTIVGVVGDVKQASLALGRTDAVYLTPEQWLFVERERSFVIRTAADAPSLAAAVRDAIWSVDKDQPIARVATMDDLLAMSAAERRFALILFETFGVAALTLAAVGVYGLLAGSVVERTREIGVRLALGASRGDVLALVLRQWLALTGLGVAVGLVGAAFASQALVSMLFGVSRLDPVTYVGVVGLLAGVSMIACSVPAWRASRVDPSITLRSE